MWGLILLAFVISINGLTVYYVLRKNAKAKINIIFSLMIVAISSWLFFNFFVDEEIQSELAVLSGRLDFTFAPIAIFLVFLFSLNFKSKNQFKWNIFDLVLILPGIVISFLTLTTDLFLKEIKIIKPGYAMAVEGDWEIVYIATLLIYLLVAVVLLIRRLMKTKGIVKMQISYILFGLTVTILFAIIVNLFAPAYIKDIESLKVLTRTANYSFLIFVICSSYAIIKYRLMDVRVLIQKSLIYIIVITGITGLYIGLIFLIESLVRGSIQIDPIVSALITTIIAVVTSSRLKIKLKELTDPIFFKQSYDFTQASSELSVILSESIDLDKIIDTSTKYVLRTLKTDKAVFMLYDKYNSKFVISNEIGAQIKKTTELDEKSAIIKYFKKYDDILISDEIALKSTELEVSNSKRNELTLFRQVLKELENLNVYVCFPIKHNNDTLGFFCLGEKRNDEVYSDADIHLLSIYANQLGLAINNALSFKEIKDKKEKMEKMNKLIIGREIKMSELKDQLNNKKNEE